MMDRIVCGSGIWVGGFGVCTDEVLVPVGREERAKAFNAETQRAQRKD
jgi:hypothetical protein